MSRMSTALQGPAMAQPGMFIDATNTYFIVPKLFNSENSLPVSERTAAGRYRVGLGADRGSPLTPPL